MRSELQEHFEALNPTWKAEAFGVAPDGDVFLTDEQVRNFQVPACRKCGGILKPDVTFFGDTVSQEKVSFVHQRLAESDSMLIAGSSMQVSRSVSQTAFLLLCCCACNDPWSHSLGLQMACGSDQYLQTFFIFHFYCGWNLALWVTCLGFPVTLCQSTSCCCKIPPFTPLPAASSIRSQLSIKARYLIQFILHTFKSEIFSLW